MYALASSGVPWAPGLCALALFCVAGVALGVLSLVFAWQVQHLMLCKGPDVRPGVFWRPLGSGALCSDFAWQARYKVFCAWILRCTSWIMTHSLTYSLQTHHHSLSHTLTHHFCNCKYMS